MVEVITDSKDVLTMFLVTQIYLLDKYILFIEILAGLNPEFSRMVEKDGQQRH